MSRDALTMFTVYWNPKDYPNRYVARRWVIEPGQTEPVPGDVVGVAASVSMVRDMIPGLLSLHRIAHQEGDDPCIVETWV